MSKEELEKATGQELIDERNYCGVDGYYGDYLNDVNAEMLKRFNRLAELEKELDYAKTHCLFYGDCPTQKENAELKSIADFQTSSNMGRYFQLKRLQEENKKTFNDWIEACDKYGEVNLKLTKAKEIINDCVCELQNILFYKMRNKERIASTLDKAEQFISEVEK